MANFSGGEYVLVSKNSYVVTTINSTPIVSFGGDIITVTKNSYTVTTANAVTYSSGLVNYVTVSQNSYTVNSVNSYTLPTNATIESIQLEGFITNNVIWAKSNQYTIVSGPFDSGSFTQIEDVIIDSGSF